MKTKETFASLLESFRYHYDIPLVFDDFLTLSIASCGRNLKTGLSYDEELYLKTIEKYKDDPLRFNFPKMFASLSLEMTERGENENDILGEYYESHLPKKGLSQFFTPYPICKFMAESAIGEAQKGAHVRPMRILDPSCGSGRMLVIAGVVSKRKHHYFGVDIDMTCVKMTVLNLFLNGVFHSEVMCANTLIPGEYRGSFIISLVPFGIFRLQEKKQSVLWHLMNNTPEGKSTHRKEDAARKADTPSKDTGNSGTQLKVF